MARAEPFTAAGIAQAWAEAQALWDAEVKLSPPEPVPRGADTHWQGEEPLAYIDMDTRQVHVNLPFLHAMGAAESLTVVLGHEVGHHVRFPHTVGLGAVLEVLEKRLIPGLGHSLTNYFFDLQVNEALTRPRAAGPGASRNLAEDLARVYRGFRDQGRQPGQPFVVHPAMAFYIAIQEALWGDRIRPILPPEVDAAMEPRFPGWRADARMFAQTFYGLHDVYLQFVYFCSRFLRYLDEPAPSGGFGLPLGADVPRPDEDDLYAAIRGRGEQEARDALQEARERGWIEDSGLRDEIKEEDPLAVIERMSQTRPGDAQAEFRQALVSKHYKELADRHLIEVPPVTPPPEPFLPSVPDEWERGDSPRSIDWTASVLTRGALAGALPLKRDLLPDEPSPVERDLPAVEVYLDTSGSMPSPASALNVMTLAAQILAASVIRHGGKVRGIVYSSGPPLVSPWMYEEETARRFLLNYAGGGTDYPFKLLRKFAAERGDVMRVIISDSDFLSNVSRPEAMDHLQYGVDRSRLLVAFLAVDEAYARQVLAPVRGHAKFRLVIVRALDQFATAARELADALVGRA